MNKSVSKLALGTANFGLDYGLVNANGKIAKTEVVNILCSAEKAGVEFIDTAQAYGSSEARLGASFGKKRFKIITKIGVQSKHSRYETDIKDLVKQSCRRLNQTGLYSVLLHRPEIILGHNGKAIIKALQSLKDQNIVSKIGISIYSPDILQPISKLIQIDMVQAPFNIFDQHLLTSGWRDKLKENDVEIHTRSVFLQGLLLINQRNLHSYFTDNWPDVFKDWYKFLQDCRLDALNVSLKFALQQEWIDKVVVGVDSCLQLEALLEIEKSSSLSEFPQIVCGDPNLINPSNWKLT